MKETLLRFLKHAPKWREMNIARTIMEQLGGRRFITMTGARDFMDFGNTLQFRLPSRFAKDGINQVRITLTPADLYDMEFGKVFKLN
jgi:hypothetical protein